MKSVNELLQDLNISRILFIDDQLELNDDEKIQQLILYLTTERENQNLKDLLAKELSKEEIEMIFEQEDFNFLFEEEDKRTFVIDVINGCNSEVMKGSAKHIEEKLADYFGSDKIESAIKPDEKDFNEFDLIVMDYNYFGGEFTALDILKSKNLNSEKLKYIIFISSHSHFEYEEKKYRMMNSESRQELFRRYSSNNILEFKALLNYISKDAVQSKDSFYAALYETLLELESGKLMFASLSSMKNLLDKGVNDAISKLLLTNSKTMQALITEKLEIEGVSETTYLIDLSLALVKNLITDSVTQMKEIHENLTNLQGWSCEIWDYETDNHLRHLRRIELLDENVNSRNAPIDFGDIFEFKIQDKMVRGILISQSCDLIVREVKGNIQRNADIASIILEVPEHTGQSCIDFRLGAEDIIFDVRKNILIPSWILDFTSLDSDSGQSRLNINSSTDRKFTWGSFFYKYVTELMANTSNDYKKLSEGVHTDWSNNIAYSFIKEQDIIDFQVSRIGRLDYLHTLTILKHKTDIETRIPLSLDISNEEIEFSLLQARLNSEETSLEFYYNEKDKCVLVDFYNILDTVQKEGYEIKPEIRQSFITEITTDHREKIFISEQFMEKRMLIIDEETAGTFKKYGIVIQNNKKAKSVDVKCRHKKLIPEEVGQK